MKLAVVLFALMTIAVASANYQCGYYQCPPGYTCLFDGHKFSCQPKCDHVDLTQTVVNQWNNNGQTYVQVQVTLKNFGPQSVKNVIIDTDNTMQLRDNTSGSIWNIVRLANGDLTLPSYAQTLAAGQTFTFGYINKNTKANMYIKSVSLA